MHRVGDILRSPMAFTKADQLALRKLQKREKQGEDINWDDVLTKRSEIGRQRWKKYGH